MPITASAKKALRQNKTRRALNTQRKTELKKAIKEVRKLTADRSADDAAQALSKLYTVADKIAKTKLIKKNKAARIKSRATKFIASLQAKKQ